MKRLLTDLMVVMVCIVGCFMSDNCLAIENDDDETIDASLPELYIKAINPGYTVDGKSNAGEMIEISRRNSGFSISLAGIAVRYTNSSGNDSVILEFPENSFLTGESILLRLASSPESELANLNYSKTLAMKGGLALMRDENVIDEVCWTGKNECYKEFVSAKPTTLVRNTEHGDFSHKEDYMPVYDATSYKEEPALEEEGYEKTPSQCKTMIFSEIFSYYETTKTEQFIEIYNYGAEQVLLDGCQIRYKNKNYVLNGIVGPEEYSVYYPKDFSLTKNPTNSNSLEIIDTDGSVVDKMVYPNGQRKGAAYAWIGYDERGEKLWKVTYVPTPGMANNYQEFKTCEVGKVINEVTGNCVKTTTVTTKTCPAGQFLNPLTGRCRKYITNIEKTCKEGYYLNPETGRCRKIVENNSADYEIKPEEYEERTSFASLYVVLGVVGLGLIYLIYEFRHEILKLWRRVC